MSPEERSPSGPDATTEQLSERLTDLEVRVAYQDRTLLALDEVVRQLALRVEVLERDLRRLEAQAATDAAVAGNPAQIGG